MNPYNIFNFQAPADLTFGAGASRQLAEKLRSLSIGRPLVVADRGVVQAGVVAQALAGLGPANISYVVFDEVEENPSCETVEKAAAVYKQEGCDGFVGIGGGSPMDVAKVASILVTNGGRPQDYEGRARFHNPRAPLVLVPTTAGTASEVTYNAVITDLERVFKFPVISPHLVPDVALCDPELTLSKPPGLTAATGMDALTHAVESFINNVENPVTRHLAAKAIELMSANLRTAVYNPGNLQARSDMLLGSTLAGMAFTVTRLGNVHAMSHPLGAYFNVPHGVANSILLPRVMAFNLPACVERMAEVARLMGERVEGLTPLEAAERAVAAVQRLSQDIKIPASLTEVGVTADKIPLMAEDTMKSGNVAVNPRRTTWHDIVHLFEGAMKA